MNSIGPWLVSQRIADCGAPPPASGVRSVECKEIHRKSEFSLQSPKPNDSVLRKKATNTHRGKGQEKMEEEIRGLHPQAKERQELPAATRS